ncbi:MAG TPA: JAB domain-containing protein [Candidatus Dormibacteraeota bacterium]|nr:JAB domain-containing protein [Candidatus Dormibacteraeota bacterium]
MDATGSDRVLLEDLIGRRASRFINVQLAELLESDESQLATFGLAPVARRRVLACAEVARRYQPRVSLPEPITGPAQAVAHLGELRSFDRETLAVLMLDAQHIVIGLELVATGAVAHVSVEAREVFTPAISAKASAIVIAHNHPSGHADPSPQDAEFTRAMVEAGRVLHIDVIDHLVVTRRSYYSFRRSGRL